MHKSSFSGGGHGWKQTLAAASRGVSLSGMQLISFIPSFSNASSGLPLRFGCSAIQDCRFSFGLWFGTSASSLRLPSDGLQARPGSSYSIHVLALVPPAVRLQSTFPSHISPWKRQPARCVSFSSYPAARDNVTLSVNVLPQVERGTSDSQVVSDDLALQDDLLWVALKERRTDDAWQALKRMRGQGLLPSGACFSRMVAQLCHLGTPMSLTRAQKIMADLQRQGQLDLLDKDALGLLAMATARGGAALYALKVVRFMLQRELYPSVKIWSAVISRLGKSVDDSKLALEFFDEICELVEDGANDQITNSSLIAMRPDTGAYNAALNACATAGHVEKGVSLFRQMPSRGLTPDVLTFNILIKLYARAEQRTELRNVVEQMVQAGVEPDASTLSSLVAAFVGLGDVNEAERLVKQMQAGLYVVGEKGASDPTKEGERGNSQPEPGIPCSAGTEEVDSGGVEKPGGAAADEAAIGSGNSWTKHLQVKPDSRTYTTLMKGYVQCGRLKDAIQILVAMQNAHDPGSIPNTVTYTTAMSALIKLGLLDEARSILQEMSAQNVPANLVTYNTLLNGFCTSQQIDKAVALLDDMAKNGMQPDVVSYNILINGCIKSDDNGRALEMFHKMRGAGILPSAISYTTLITAFGRNAQPALAAQVFAEMTKDERVKVDVVAWNAYIEAFCKAGQMSNARKAFLDMKQAGIQPSVATYNSLVRGHAASGNHQSGEVLVLWKEISERIEAKQGDGVVPLKPDEGLLNCLVDTCVRAGFFQKAIEVVACIERHGLPANKAKYKRMFIELYSNLYTGKHASQRRRDKSKDRRRAVELFKFWVGLPNSYYDTDWSPLKKSTE